MTWSFSNPERSIEDVAGFLPVLTVEFFLGELESYRDAAFNMVLPAFQRLYEESESEFDSSGVAVDSEARANAVETLFYAEQSTVKVLVVGLHHLFEQQRKLMFEGQGGRLSDFERLLLERIGLDATRWCCRAELEDLRCATNVIKHASDQSAKKLQERRPDLFSETEDLLVSPVLTNLTVYVPQESLEDWFDAVRVFWTTLRNQLDRLAGEGVPLHLRL